MKCARCGNTDPSYFYHGSNGWYCRRCIRFGRIMLEEEMEPVEVEEIQDSAEEYQLLYPLTPQQQRISDACIKALREKDVLIHAVCGAGKTEIMTGVISHYLKQKRKVCFAIARRQVVLEVSQRYQNYFPHARVVPVCGGYTEVTDGDLIVCTTHQLYRYYRTFDLLILDESDAYPYKGDFVLQGIASSSCIGRMVYLTATPDEYLKERVRNGTLVELRLDQRPHGKPIPVPEIRILPEIIMAVYLIVWLYAHSDHPCIVFVPSIAMAKRLRLWISLFRTCLCVTGQDENRDEIIASFRNGEADVIVATTVLERGVTIPDADVCVYHGENEIFDEAALIQMAGRAGRNFNNPYGDVLFLCSEKSRLCMQCRKEIMEANETL